MRRNVLGLLLALVVAMAGWLNAAQISKAAEPVATQPAVGNVVGEPDPANAVEVARIVDEPTRRVVKLANGLTIILQENHTAPVVACRVYVKAGSLTEQQYMGAGISHVLEHLVAGASSAKRKEKEAKALLRTIGNDSNAYTSFNQTVYFITTTAGKWPVAMDLLSDWVTNADFSEGEFQREYKVVQRELEMGEAEADRTFSKLTFVNRYTVFPARHPVIGYKSAFQKLTREDCQKYYNQMYVPDNMVVSVAGDINLDEAQKVIAGKFSHVKRKKVPAISLPEEPAVTAPRTLVGHADVKQARVQWGFPTVTMYNQDMYALDALANVMGQGESSILIRKLRHEKGLVTGLAAYSDTPEYAPGSFDVMAELPAAKISDAREAFLDEIKTVIAHGVDAAQLEKAKNQMAAELVYGDQTAEQQASKNASDYLATGNLNFSQLYVERIKAVTPEMVQEVAKKYLKPEVLLTTILLPLGTPETVVTSRPAEAVASKLPVQKITLENGMTVLVCKNTSSPLVVMNLYVLGGLLAENDANNGIGTAMMTLLTHGTASMSDQQIAEYFDRTGGTISAVSGNNTFGVSCTALKENAEKTFGVFADICLHANFPDKELERARPQMLASADRATEDWFGEGYAFLRKSYFESSPYKRLPSGSVDVLSKLTREQIAAHYQQFFNDPEHAVLAIYGDIDPAKAAEWARQFAAMPKTQAKLNLASAPAGPKNVTAVTNKQSAAVFVAYGPGMKVNSDDRFAMTILQTILGGYSYPSGWLFDTLRGQGLVYVVQASNITGPVNGMFMIVGLGEPEKVPAIEKVIDAKIADAKDGKFTDQEISLAKDQAITGIELSEQTIGGQAQGQSLDELMGNGYKAHDQQAEQLRKVTREDLLRVAKQYLQNPVIAVTSPEAAKAPSKGEGK